MPRRVRLAAWRKGQGLSQRDVASLLSAALGRPVRQQNVGQWESGVMPGADVAEAIRALTGGRVTGESFGRHSHPSTKERNRP